MTGIDDQDDREERVRKRAYEIWRSEGERHGQHERHWHQARAEVGKEGSSGESSHTEGTIETGASLIDSDAGLASGLQPSGTVPGEQPGASMGSIGTGGGSTGGRGTGAKRRSSAGSSPGSNP